MGRLEELKGELAATIKYGHSRSGSSCRTPTCQRPNAWISAAISKQWR